MGEDRRILRPGKTDSKSDLVKRRLIAGRKASLELEPLRYAATFVAGPSDDLAVREPLLAQGMEHLEYFLARLPVGEPSTPAMRCSVNNCVLRQDGPARCASRKALLFFDHRAKVLDQMEQIGDLAGLPCAFTHGLRI